MMRDFQHILLIYLPIFILSLIFKPYRIRILTSCNLRTTPLHEIGLQLMIFSITSIAVLKLWPYYLWRPSDGAWGDLVLLIGRPSYTSSINLIPFSSIIDYIKFIKVGVSDIWDVSTNLVGNILCFIPMGFLPPLLFRHCKTWHTLFYGTMLSLVTEFGQYFIMRFVSIDNVILNIIGTICGYLLFRFISKTFPECVDKIRLSDISKSS